MSLNVNTKSVTPKVTDAEEWTVFGVGLCMMATGISHLKSDADVAEMTTRIRVYNLSTCRPIFIDRIATEKVAFWQRWKGVAANITPMTRNQFAKHLMEDALRCAERDVRHEMKDR